MKKCAGSYKLCEKVWRLEFELRRIKIALNMCLYVLSVIFAKTILNFKLSHKTSLTSKLNLILLNSQKKYFCRVSVSFDTQFWGRFRYFLIFCYIFCFICPEKSNITRWGCFNQFFFRLLFFITEIVKKCAGSSKFCGKVWKTTVSANMCGRWLEVRFCNLNTYMLPLFTSYFIILF